MLSDNEIAFNEAIIEEREQGIQEIQQQISEVNEIFKDLAVLVQDQGALIGKPCVCYYSITFISLYDFVCLTLHDFYFFSDDFSSNIDNSHSATAQAASQLSKASKLQKANSSLIIYNSCLSLFFFFRSSFFLKTIFHD